MAFLRNTQTSAISCSWESRCRVEGGSGRRSRRFAISAFIRSLRNLLAPFVDLLASILQGHTRPSFKINFVYTPTHEQLARVVPVRVTSTPLRTRASARALSVAARVPVVMGGIRLCQSFLVVNRDETFLKHAILFRVSFLMILRFFMRKNRLIQNIFSKLCPFEGFI